MSQEKDKNIYICMALCFLAGIASFGYFMYSHNGILLLRDDFNYQQIPFLTALNRCVKNFTGTWCWNVDLGTQMVGAYSFYNLGSPFVWGTFLFPESWVPYLMGWFYILKYMVAGVTAYLYLRMFVKNRSYAIAGALLYSFSGFQSTNLLFFHFHDAVAFFPLLLIGLENLITHHKKALFIFAVFINCMVNFFFFISEVIFLILYYILRFWKKDLVLFFKNGLTCVLCGMIGAGMAAALFLPSILYITGSSRTAPSLSLQTLFYYAGYVLLAAKGFLLPGEPMSSQSSILPQYFMSANCYLPMVGGSLAFSYILKRKKDWLTRLLVILWIFSCSPVMDSAFYLFTQSYKRWWFMFILMLAAASVTVLDNIEEYPVKAGLSVNMFLLIAFGAVTVYLDKASWTGSSFIFDQKMFLASCGISLAGLLLTWVWRLTAGKNRTASRSLLAGISLFCVLTTSYGVNLYQKGAESTADYMDRYHLGLQLKNLDSQYRYNLTDNLLTFTGEAAGTGSFSSTISNSVHDFDKLFDFDRLNISLTPDSVPGLRELMAAKYSLTSSLLPDQTPLDTLTVSGKTWYITEEPVCPIGFTQDSYMTQEELCALPVDKRGVAMLDNLIIHSSKEDFVSSHLKHREQPHYSDNHSEIPALVSLSQKNKVTDFVRDQSGFQCRADIQSEKAVFFSIPFDNGWRAYINEKRTDILNCGGMMGILLSPGEYDISFQYHIPGLKAGMWISLFSICVFIAVAYGETEYILPINFY